MLRLFCAFGAMLLLALSSSCRLGDVDPPVLNGDEYFPVELGQYIVYDVVRIKYNPFSANDTSHLELFEAIVDTFSSSDNHLQYRVQQWVRLAGTRDAWQPDSVLSIRKEEGRMVKNESNVPYVALIFPLSEESKWNGNLLNTRPAQTYSVTDYQASKTINRTVFDNTMTVLQQYDTSRVRDDIRYEVYAKDIGMVQRYSISLTYQQEDGTVVEPRIISTGVFTERRYIRNGVSALPVHPEK